MGSCIFFSLLGSLFCFLMERKHFLMCLLSMEATMLTGLMGMVFIAQQASQTFVMIPVLVLMVVEASVGLSVLVSLSSVATSEMVSA